MEITKGVVLPSWRDEEYRNTFPEDVRNALGGGAVGYGAGEAADALTDR